ncbi:YqaJ viral recombinase family protein [Noviherbaspirillum malthae]|uniref:YqaJ viral recombinase family protein n=1 Tax=Noviherbaspirillum malthae TaxID=1260987 RepID=UPI00188FF944|nr:YqaJ viral recombinase family protein [Noviherbaspirillum malthae]
MIIHDLVQGSPEWKAYRANHFNASDAPAMMGCSPYKSRSELLREMHTGVAQEVDAMTQRRFDDGHRFEALARPLAEQIIGQDIYPVVGSKGRLSASFDGLTMAEDVGFEHKSLNDDLRAVMVNGCTGADLPMHYQVQMEQQCMVSGASKILFMASTWNGDQLVEERHCWYEANLDLAVKIVEGWKQFEIDLEAYVAPEAKVEAVGRTPESLPALRIEVTGLVTASNLGTFRDHALAVFGNINRDLKTDQDFADAEKTVKWCGDVEDRLDAAKQHALSQTESIDTLFRTIEEIKAQARATRLELDKLVKARKEQVREEIRIDGVNALRDHIASLNERLGKPYMPTVAADFAGAMKGKKTVTSLRDAVSTTLANAKIEANAAADRIQKNLTALREQAKDHAFLFADAGQLVLKAPDDCQAVITARIAEHKAAEEKRLADERERIAAEERKKAEEAVNAAFEKEAAALRRRHEVEVAAARQQAMLEAAQTRRVEEATAAEQPLAAPAQVVPMASRTPTLRLGQINDMLGFNVTADFLSSLGIPPAATDKNAKLYHNADFPKICAAISRHAMAAGHQFMEQLAA